VAGGRRGFTIVEVLVAASIALLVLGVAFALLRPALQRFSQGRTRAELQRQAETTLDRLEIDLRLALAATASVGTGTDPTILGLVRAQDITPQGAQVWEKGVETYIYDPVQQQLRRSEWTPDAPPSLPVTTNSLLGAVAPVCLLDAELRQLAPPRGASVLMCQNLVTFDVQVGTPPGPPSPSVHMASPVLLHLVLQASSSASSTPEQYEVKRSVWFRNKTLY
jgi:prepilin-type N-terminal cleavage/methylation domain-containing protein